MRFPTFNLFGRRPAATQLTTISAERGWWPIVVESFAGAWQRNVEVKPESVLAYHAVFACQTLIASDIAKLRCKLVALNTAGVWSEVTNPAYSPVLRKPNHYQNRMQFFESWVLSKLQSGNTYILKERDGRGVVVKLHVLSPDRCRPMVSESGDVYYELSTDYLSGLPDQIMVPAREVIHDRFNTFFHPLVGISPIYANGLAATQGLAAQTASTRLFQNGARPGGVLTAPGEIGEDNAKRLKAYWDDNFTGANAGKVAVLGDGLKFETLGMKSVDAQVLETLKWSAEVVCSTYHVPTYKVGIGVQPTYNNVQALNTEYYSQALQVLIEAIELCLDEGLGTGDKLGTEFDVDNLLRMDSVTQMTTLKEGISGGILSPNEARAKIDRDPVPGGETPYLQQQNFSLLALSKRDAMANPFTADGKSITYPARQPSAEVAEIIAAEVEKGLAELRERLSVVERSTGLIRRTVEDIEDVVTTPAWVTSR